MRCRQPGACVCVRACVTVRGPSTAGSLPACHMKRPSMVARAERQRGARRPAGPPLPAAATIRPPASRIVCAMASMPASGSPVTVLTPSDIENTWAPSCGGGGEGRPCPGRSVATMWPCSLAACTATPAILELQRGQVRRAPSAVPPAGQGEAAGSASPLRRCGSGGTACRQGPRGACRHRVAQRRQRTQHAFLTNRQPWLTCRHRSAQR